MLRASEIIRTATHLVAQYGDQATAYARTKAQSCAHDPKARASWEQVTHAISIIADFDPKPLSRAAA